MNLSLRLGSCEAMAGLSIPLRVLSTYRAMAISAPVLPADTTAQAWASLTCVMATRMLESFFVSEGGLERVIHGDNLCCHDKTAPGVYR
jgi:hypothetical protein